MDYEATAGRLEEIVNKTEDPDRRARAFAALTLSRVLAPMWTHVVATRDAKGRPNGYETVKKPAGTLMGDRAALESRLEALLADLV